MLFLLLSATAFAGALVNCDYKIMGAPFSQVSLGFVENQPEDFVTISMQGRSHRESYTPSETNEEEMTHGWISLESEENSLEMVIYRERKQQGRAKLINSRMPFGKEIWGECEISKPAP
jgi:hypothetical protein